MIFYFFGIVAVFSIGIHLSATKIDTGKVAKALVTNSAFPHEKGTQPIFLVKKKGEEKIPFEFWGEFLRSKERLKLVSDEIKFNLNDNVDDLYDNMDYIITWNEIDGWQFNDGPVIQQNVKFTFCLGYVCR